MSKDEMVKLIEALYSAGYEIREINLKYKHDIAYGNIKLLIFPLNINILLKEKMVKFIETLTYAGFEISKYEILNESGLIELLLFQE